MKVHFNSQTAYVFLDFLNCLKPENTTYKYLIYENKSKTKKSYSVQFRNKTKNKNYFLTCERQRCYENFPSGKICLGYIFKAILAHAEIARLPQQLVVVSLQFDIMHAHLFYHFSPENYATNTILNTFLS